MLTPDQKILLVLGQETDLDVVQRHLLRIGIENIGGFLRKGMRSWLEAGRPFQTLGQLSVHQLRAEQSSWQILDVRQDGEWEAGHLEGALHAFVPHVAKGVAQLDKEKPLAVYCGSGYRASIAASVLQAQGFQHVFNVPGSMKAWKAAGYPLVN